MAGTLALVVVILQYRLQFSNVSSFRLFHTDRITGFLSSKIKHWNTTLQQRVIPVKLLQLSLAKAGMALVWQSKHWIRVQSRWWNCFDFHFRVRFRYSSSLCAL